LDSGASYLDQSYKEIQGLRLMQEPGGTSLKLSELA
jgi:hypothetical protein